MYDTTVRNNKVHKLVRVGLFTLTYVIVQRTENGVYKKHNFFVEVASFSGIRMDKPGYVESCLSIRSWAQKRL